MLLLELLLSQWGISRMISSSSLLKKIKSKLLVGLPLALLLGVPAITVLSQGISKGPASSGSLPVAPIITSITGPSAGTYTTGVQTFLVNTNAAITVAGGVPGVNLNTATPSQALCNTGSGTTQLTCTITLGSGLTANPVATTATGFSTNGATLVNGSGTGLSLTGANSITFTGVIFNPTDVSPPVVSSITSKCAGTISAPGTDCVFQVNWTETVFISGGWKPLLNLATNPVPAIAYLCNDTNGTRTLPAYAQTCGGLGSGSGTKTLNFYHRVLGGQNAATVATSNAAITLFNSTTIQNASLTNATLTGANNVSIAGLSYSAGNALCVAPTGGSDSNSGICGTNALATLVKAQTLARSGSVKTIFLRAGTFGPGLATSAFDTNGSANRKTTYILQASADNGQFWAAYPGEDAIIDGQATSNVTGVGVAFASNSGDPINGMMFQGLEIAHFANGGLTYNWQPSNLIVEDNNIHDLYNQDAAAGGCVSTYNWWQSISIRNNNCNNMQGFGVKFTGPVQSSVNSFAMTAVVDANNISLGCSVVGDCGLIYTGWFPFASTISLGHKLQYITDNYLSGAGTANSQGVCLYNDDYASGNYEVGNVCLNMFSYFVAIHNGSNNDVYNNVFDITAMAAVSNANNPSIFYMANSNACSQFGTCNVNSGNNIAGNIVVDISGTNGPRQFNGLYYGGATLSPPAMGTGASPAQTNWYAAVFGTFPASQAWATTTFGGGASVVTDTSGVLISTVNTPNLFVNAAAQTLPGYQLQAGTAPLIAGTPFNQLDQTAGFR